MNILVTGGCGYIGSRLVPKLLADGHKVTVLDTQWFGHGYLPTDNENLTFIKGDVRDGFPYKHDAVIWLASVSNNEMYGINYALTNSVNTYLELSVNAKFIYASSVAVLDPTSDYAKDKLICEGLLRGYNATIVRAASVVGYAPNMRFDTTINRMTHDAYKTGVITVNGGDQVRTHVHIDDLCEFYRGAISSKNNAPVTLCAISQKISETALNVQRCFEDMGKVVRIETRPRSDDRSYSVDVKYDWSPRSVFEGVRDLIARFDQGMWKDTTDEKMWRINRSI